MRVVVGLGNPGSSYARSRHNVGFWVLDALARRHRLRFSKREYKSQVAAGKIADETVLLLKPQTYMNLSGEAVGRARRDLGLDPTDFLVVYDDLDLALGRIRVKANGGSGGHHGVDSIIESLGSKAFPRVRVGIGRPASKSANLDYLLDAMSAEEVETLEEAVESAADAAETVLRDGIAKAMSGFNGTARPSARRR